MSSKKAAKSVFWALFLLLLSVILCTLAWFSLTIPYRKFAEPVFVEIPKGMGTRGIANELARDGVIRYPWQFLLARVIRPNASLQAGEYQFTAAASVLTVFHRIARGDIFYYELTVPEGSNMFDIATNVENLGASISANDFLAAARQPAMIHDFAPNAPTLEGYLFPSTYRLTRKTTAQQLCARMTTEFRHEWKLLNAGTGRDVNAVVTMASLIEKETAVPAERPVVASVYENRLLKGISLDCDPATIYAALLENRYRGTIYQSDLQSMNAYNTYRHAGLPPGPIANPGIASLKAALAPAKTDFLYFVAKPDGSGSHHFSATLAEHNRAVQEYRRGLKSGQQASPVG